METRQKSAGTTTKSNRLSRCVLSLELVLLLQDFVDLTKNILLGYLVVGLGCLQASARLRMLANSFLAAVNPIHRITKIHRTH